MIKRINEAFADDEFELLLKAKKKTGLTWRRWLLGTAKKQLAQIKSPVCLFCGSKVSLDEALKGAKEKEKNSG